MIIVDGKIVVRLAGDTVIVGARALGIVVSAFVVCGPRGPETETIALAGMFELFNDAESDFRFRLTAPDGTVMAVSKPLTTKKRVRGRHAAVREYAAWV